MSSNERMQTNKRTNARCKYAIRYIKHNENQLRKESLARNLRDLDTNAFLKEIRLVNKSATPLPTNIDGV